jgi:hypothetical protein
MRARLRERGNDPFGGGAPEETADVESPVASSSTPQSMPSTPVSVEAGLSPPAAAGERRPRRPGQQGTAGFLGLGGMRRTLSNLGSLGGSREPSPAPPLNEGSVSPRSPVPVQGHRHTVASAAAATVRREDEIKGPRNGDAAAGPVTTPVSSSAKSPIGTGHRHTVAGAAGAKERSETTPTSANSRGRQKTSVIGVPQATQLTQEQRVQRGKEEAVKLLLSPGFKQLDDRPPQTATREKLKLLLANGPAAYAIRMQSKAEHNTENLDYLEGARSFLALKDDPATCMAALMENHALGGLAASHAPTTTSEPPSFRPSWQASNASPMRRRVF